MTRLSQLIVVIAILDGSAAAQTDTTFTYQGELKESGEPANGSFDMDFSLWNAPSGGSQVGSTIQFNGQPVTDGLFTVGLDFGADVFDGSQLWLEITVDDNQLTPRQPITSAPYSIHTRGIFVDDAGNVGIRTGSPVFPLEVHNNGITGQLLRLASDRTHGYMQFAEGSTPRAYLGYGDDGDLLVNALPDSFAIDGANTALHFAVDSDATKGITITTYGNVGIGTTSTYGDVTKLHVITGSTYGEAVAVRGEATYGGTAANIGGYFSAAGTDGEGVHSEASGANGIGVRGLADGYFGCGLKGDSSGGNGIGVFGEASGNDGVGVRGEAPGSDGEGVHGYAAGIDGIGVRGIAAGVNGWGVEGIAYGANGWGVSGYANGGDNAVAVHGYGFNTWDFFAGGPGGHYGEISSIRWKSNVRNIEQPLEKMARLRGVYFDWDLEHGGQHDVGMIAEEVGTVLPEIVRYEENGIDANGMDYGKLTPLLVEAVNALRAEKDAEIAELKQRVSDLERTVEQLTSKGTQEEQ